MTIAYHGTPITPLAVLRALCHNARRNFCVSFFRPDQVVLIDELSAEYFLDNGAFSAWKKGIVLNAAYWSQFYEWAPIWLARRASWFVIPDVIDAGTQEQDALIRECPAELLPYRWPVWHMDEPPYRLLALIERFGRVCIGSTAEYRVVGSPDWRDRMDEAFTAIQTTFGSIPPVHMLRGLQCLEWDYPFTSVDSTNIARNHNRTKKYGEQRLWATVQMADRWDRLDCPTTWPPPRLAQLSMLDIAA